MTIPESSILVVLLTIDRNELAMWRTTADSMYVEFGYERTRSLMLSDGTKDGLTRRHPYSLAEFLKDSISSGLLIEEPETMNLKLSTVGRELMRSLMEMRRLERTQAQVGAICPLK